MLIVEFQRKPITTIGYFGDELKKRKCKFEIIMLTLAKHNLSFIAVKKGRVIH
jgi:hypothetical protein